jgi:AraC-like DNA-binding protein
MVPVESSPPLPENVVGLEVSERTWNGVQLSVAVFQCKGEVIVPLPQQDKARLGVILEESGGRCEARFHPNTPCPIGHMPRYLHFSPADQEVWGHTNARRVIDATLAFDFDALSEALAMRFDPTRVSVPLARFSDDRIWTLVKLLSEAVNNPDPSSQLYGDGLVAAIASQTFAAPLAVPDRTGKLAPWQLRRVIDYMEDNFPNRIELETLAAQLNLSQAHFSRAFKASTGLAPYQWQLDARIKRAQHLLCATSASLEEVAQATGFADTVHFGHTFRKIAGMAPGAWRSQRKR